METVNLNELIAYCISAIVVPVLIWAIKQAGSWLKAKAAGEHAAIARALIDRVEGAIIHAINRVEKSIVAAAKNSGDWDKTAMKAAKTEAIDLVKNKLLDPQNLRDLVLLYEGDNRVRDLIDNLIESHISAKKINFEREARISMLESGNNGS